MLYFVNREDERKRAHNLARGVRALVFYGPTGYGKRSLLKHISNYRESDTNHSKFTIFNLSESTFKIKDTSNTEDEVEKKIKATIRKAIISQSDEEILLIYQGDLALHQLKIIAATVVPYAKDRNLSVTILATTRNLSENWADYEFSQLGLLSLKNTRKLLEHFQPKCSDKDAYALYAFSAGHPATARKLAESLVSLDSLNRASWSKNAASLLQKCSKKTLDDICNDYGVAKESKFFEPFQFMFSQFSPCRLLNVGNLPEALERQEIGADFLSRSFGFNVDNPSTTIRFCKNPYRPLFALSFRMENISNYREQCRELLNYYRDQANQVISFNNQDCLSDLLAELIFLHTELADDEETLIRNIQIELNDLNNQNDIKRNSVKKAKEKLETDDEFLLSINYFFGQSSGSQFDLDRASTILNNVE